ncbi:hypothetical protein FI667_g1977, partial [Globisporangium splendens]
MLSLNSYGCTRPLPSNSNNHRHVVLPRLVLSGGSGGGGSGLSPSRAISSLSKLEMARADAHPLYRTTAGFDYGRHLDFKDVALSCPKHAKPAKFTKDFIAGTFTDTSLTSIDKSKLRAECWQRKVTERTAQMQIKHEELQHALETKKQVRKHARDQKRREMEMKRHAATVIQARIRGIQTRARLHKEMH